MINYNCRKIWILLLKRWYIVLAMTVLVSIGAIPLAKISYQRAEENYEQLHIADEDREYNLYASYSIDEKSTGDLNIYGACLNDEFLMNSVCKKNSKKMDWTELSKNMTFSYNKDTREFVIIINQVKKDELTFLINATTVWLKEYYEEANAGKIMFKQESYEESEVVIDVLQEPKVMNSNSRIVITAGIMGFVLGCFAVLMMDYVSKSRKQEE